MGEKNNDCFLLQGNTRAPPSPKSPPNSPNLEFSDSEEINSHIYINRYISNSFAKQGNIVWELVQLPFYFEGLLPPPARKCRPSSGIGPPPPPPAPTPPQHLQKTGLSPCLRGPRSVRNPPRAGVLGPLQGCSSQILCPFSSELVLVCGYIAGTAKLIASFSKCQTFTSHAD